MGRGCESVGASDGKRGGRKKSVRAEGKVEETGESNARKEQEGASATRERAGEEERREKAQRDSSTTRATTESRRESHQEGWIKGEESETREDRWGGIETAREGGEIKAHRA